ncbi:MAG: hypothetical protein A2Z38_05320 [Planctomycetes bacterium RBG_19FT_COMBO_48_8]|nr:MAG: hypothetical protein A2Z38_05320 [Planctomycetes bacterium RBG_19FT_COMBO_48_8]
MCKVIAVLDVLGFKNRLSREGLPALRQAYDALKGVVSKQEARMMLNCAVPVEGGRAAAFGMLDVGHELTSDSIFLWCSYSTFHFPPFRGLLLEFFCEVLELGIPLRGGVAVGEADIDKKTRTYTGVPLNEAASVEGAQNWIGVSFGPSFAQPPYNWFEPDQAIVYRAHRKPSKADLVPGAVLDWPRKWRDTRQTPADSVIQQMNVDPKFSIYYENTMRFIDFSEQNKDWYHGGGSISVKS